MIRRLLDDPLVWAGAVALVALWCMGQALAGEPGLPSESLPPAAYVVEAPVPAGAVVSAPPVVLVGLPPALLEPTAPAAPSDRGAP